MAFEHLSTERAGEECLDHGAELLVGVAGVGAEGVEGGVQLDAAALGEHALGLLDGDTAVQRTLELLVKQTGFGKAAFLEEADGGDIGKSLTDLDLGLGQGGRVDAKMLTAPMTSPRSRIGRAWTVVRPRRRASMAKLGHWLSGGAEWSG